MGSEQTAQEYIYMVQSYCRNLTRATSPYMPCPQPATQLPVHVIDRHRTGRLPGLPAKT